MVIAHRSAFVPGVLVLLAVVCVSCARDGGAVPELEDFHLALGVGFVGETQITYEVWEIDLTKRGIGKFFFKSIGTGTVVCLHEAAREARRAKYFADQGRPTSPTDWQALDLHMWASFGYDGWLWFGKGIWSDSLIPSKIKAGDGSRATQLFGAYGLTNRLVKPDWSTCVVISIVPPVFGLVDLENHQCLLDNGCSYTSELGAFMCSSPDLDCVVRELWCVRSAGDGENVIAHRLLPEGTTMTIREIFEKGPSLWQEDLDAMTDWLEPRVFEDPKK